MLLGMLASSLKLFLKILLLSKTCLKVGNLIVSASDPRFTLILWMCSSILVNIRARSLK